MKTHVPAACLGFGLGLLFPWLSCGAGTGTAAAPASAGAAPGWRRVYAHLLEPREHPDYDRRAVKPPDWGTFQHRTQFTTLRGFNLEQDRIVGYAEELEKHTRQFELGDVIWPSYPILFARNLGDLAAEIRRRNLYLFDVWGYVPGSGPGGYWQQFQPPASAFATLEAALGERWLGTDIGEQDGRYIGGYANQMTPASGSRFEQYLNFQRHFERMSDELGHKHATLVSLNFGHYFLKEGTYTLIGAETAQALPNSQVYYAFIRGAGKQYGVPWFGNASIFNRWGYKSYGGSGRSDGYEFGPTKGTSLSLMKRLLYSHLLYNCVAAGFENGWFEGDRLSPLGRIQQAAQRWVKAHGPPGVQHTPVALLLDFYSGWSFPRHLYAETTYRVWGNLPYAEGDFFTDAVLDLLYPGYQDASYFHDERGFLVPTPYGDLADGLLSDAPSWLLERYPLLIVAGEVRPGRELAAKLWRYAERGGHLVLTGANFRRLVEPESGLRPAEPAPGVTRVGSDALEELPFALCGVGDEADGDEALATHGGEPIAVTQAEGRGRITVFWTPYGLTSRRQAGPVTSEIDRPLAQPYPMLRHVRLLLDRLLREQMLFDAGAGLSVITCRKAPGEYTVGIANPAWREAPLRLTSRCGPILALRELPLDQSEKGAVGYTPEGVDPGALGRSGPETIAGGDVRLFAVQVRETNLVELPHAAPPPRPRGRWLPLRRLESIREEVLARPTFFEHFDGVLVDWRALHERERAAWQAEAGWLRRQGLRIAVDLSSGVDLYPTLRLIANLPADYDASLAAIAAVLDKMSLLGARDLLLSLHRHPENNFTAEQTRAAFDATLQQLAARAAERGITLHLRLAFGKPPWSLAEAAALLERVAAPNLKLAPSTALLLAAGASPTGLPPAVRERLGLWLLAGPGRDLAGQLWDAHAPLAGLDPAEWPRVAAWLATAPDLPWVLDGVYADADAEYADAQALHELAAQRAARPRP